MMGLPDPHSFGNDEIQGEEAEPAGNVGHLLIGRGGVDVLRCGVGAPRAGLYAAPASG
jgi:hypothetical protein